MRALLDVNVIIALLDENHANHATVSTPYHQFVADDISLLDDAAVVSESLSGPSQISDIYLLALAVTHGLRFVTLDRRVPLAAVREAREESLVII